jgi:hypothetical protein
MNITSQEVNNIFLVIFELKENTNKKQTNKVEPQIQFKTTSISPIKFS